MHQDKIKPTFVLEINDQ